MIEGLKKIYKDQIVIAESPSNFLKYVWFHISPNEYIGIVREALKDRDVIWLNTFLTRVEQDELQMSEIENWWYHFLLNDETKLNVDMLEQELFYQESDSFRFVQFQFTKAFSQQSEWQEAIQSFFEEATIELIWQDDISGIIIEKQAEIQEATTFTDIIEMTASDFYADVKLFIGSFHPFTNNLPQLFRWETKCFSIAQKFESKTKHFRLEKSIPYVMIHELSKETVKEMQQSFLTSFPKEKELLDTIKIYIENNLNVSLTAKKLYMHRNSLQYRIDKFIERTNIDIRNFQGAFVAYLAILLLEYEKEVG